MRKDPLRKLYVHVGLVVALMAFVLVFSVMYVSLPQEPSATGLVVYQYPSLGISSGLHSFADAVKTSPDKPFIMLAFYTMWIIIVGTIAMAVHEQKRKKF
jgi:hypothetical protein